MINHPALILVALIGIESAILLAASHPRTKHFFKILPAVFWVYFLPLVCSTAGLIASDSPLYGWSLKYILPASLFLLLLGVDLKAIARLGPKGIMMFLAGSFGIMLGTFITFMIFKNIVGPEFWTGFGALSGSWMGGSANMVAVKEAIGTPDDIFLPMVVVDTIVPYVWMGLLIFLSGWQEKIDRFNKADRTVLDEIHKNISGAQRDSKQRLTVISVIGLGAVAFLISYLLQSASPIFPIIKGIISPFAWVIILASTVGLVCSLTPLRKLEEKGSSKIGYFLLYFVLTTIGVKATLAQLGTSAVLIAAGFLIIAIHAVVLIITARILKAPMMLAAAASQANIGGVASGPVVAEVYQPGLSTIGLLMAILGNILGTYLGILSSQICRMMAG